MKVKDAVLYVFAGLMWVVPCAVAQDMVDMGQPAECSLPEEAMPCPAFRVGRKRV